MEELGIWDNYLQEYAKHILDKIEPEPKKDVRGSLIDFFTNAIKEKEEALTCPVCLEVVEAPIYMCQQMHLICATCRPRVAACPECRKRYKGMQIHRYAERDAVELKKMKEEFARVTSL